MVGCLVCGCSGVASLWSAAQLNLSNTEACRDHAHPLTCEPPSPSPSRPALQLLVALEEESRKKAAVHKRRYAGPMVRWKSQRVGDAERVSAAMCGAVLPVR